MTRLAFGAKCGAFGASGLTNAGLPAANNFWFNNDPSAIVPSPTPHCLKNQRRVIAIRRSFKKCSGVVIGYSFVIVSSRFSNARDTTVYAASCVGVVPGGSFSGFSFLPVAS